MTTATATSTTAKHLKARMQDLIAKARPEVKILQALSLSMQRGQKVAVVGESGSGKSTAPRRVFGAVFGTAP